MRRGLSLWFGALVALYPPGFRRAVGVDLRRTLSDGARDARRRGLGGLARYLVENSAACARDAALEWVAIVTETGKGGGGRMPTMDAVRVWKVSVRGLLKRPGYAIPVLLTLALGVGANTAMFTVLNAVVLRDLPYPEPDQLVRLWPADPDRGYDTWSFSLPDARDWAERTSSLAAMGAYSTLPGGPVYTGGDDALELRAAYVTAGFYEALAVPPLLGRLPSEEEERGDNRVVVVSHAFFVQHLGGDAGRVGTPIPLDDEPFVVVGVMPPGFAFPEPGLDAWLFLSVIPPQEIPLQLRGVRLLGAVGRLAPGTTLQEAESELTALASALAAEYPDSNGRGRAAVLLPLSESVVGGVDSALVLLMVAAVLILLIACANVANLALAREARRSTELAVRAALGASASSRIGIVLRESLTLSVLGGALGLGLAAWGTGWLAASAGDTLPRAHEIGPDLRVVGFALLLSVLTGAAFALVPGMRAGNDELSTRLRSGSRSSTTGGMRGVLVISQISLSVVLTAGAFLLVRSLGELARVDLGFEPDRLVVADMTFGSSRYPERGDYLRRFEETFEAFRAIPGVASVGSIRRFPFRGQGEGTRWTLPGMPEDAEGIPGAIMQVGGDFFEAMGMRFVEGGPFPPGHPDDARITVVNESLARAAYGRAPAVGRPIRLGPWELEIVGVVEDIRQRSLTDAGVNVIHLPNRLNSRRGAAFLLRTEVDPEGLLAAVRQRIREADPDQPFTELTTARDVVAGELSRPGFFTTLLAALAALAVGLASVGVYGVVAYGVSQRRREVGIRLAVGADAGRIRAMIVRQGMGPVVLGLAAGVVLTVLASRWVESLLYGVGRLDPASYASAVGTLSVVGLIACWVPARSASATRPTEAIATE